jgi:ankyrin repeat protein
LIEKGADINAANKKGVTPLMQAADNEKDETVKFILEKLPEKDINIKDNNGKSALIYAVERNLKEAVKMIIDKKADVNAGDNNGQNALQYAETRGKDGEIISLLKAAGAK